MFELFRRYCDCLAGSTATEYGLIAAGIALAIVASVFTFGDELEALFQGMQPALQAIPAEVETSR